MSVNEERIDRLTGRLNDLLKAKNKAYGNSVCKVPALASWLPVDSAILVRMSDKIARLDNLMDKANQDGPTNDLGESIEDTLMDLAGYCLLLIQVREGENNDSKK